MNRLKTVTWEWLHQVDRLLRGHSPWPAQRETRPSADIVDDWERSETTAAVDPPLRETFPWWLLVSVTVFGSLYGLAMGCFTGLQPNHHRQLVYSAVKVPLLLLVSCGLSLPSYFVISTLFGLRADLSKAVRSILASQVGMTVVLAALAPITLVWYASSSDYTSAVSFNGVIFIIASVAAQVLLRRFYQPLIQRDPKHRLMLIVWLLAYWFVAIQMAWVLRPFIGEPGQPPQFLRRNIFEENAYEVVFRLISSAIRRLIEPFVWRD